jgi:hypothetical protein
MFVNGAIKRDDCDLVMPRSESVKTVAACDGFAGVLSSGGRSVIPPEPSVLP